jgi:hypothetical protein
MGQKIIICLIGILVVVYLFRKVYLYFCNKKNRTNRCNDCPGCAFNPKKNKD